MGSIGRFVDLHFKIRFGTEYFQKGWGRSMPHVNMSLCNVVSARLKFGTQLSTRSYDFAVPESYVNAAKYT